MSEPTPFQYPKVDCGDRVRVSFDKAFSKPMYGKVRIPKPKSVVLEVTNNDGRIMVYNDCRHRDDPYLLDHPDFIGQPGHAIFELCEEAKTLAYLKATVETLVATVETLVKLVEQQAREIAALKSAMASWPQGDGDGLARRGPGRPKRLEPVEVA